MKANPVRRNADSHRAILGATVELLRERGLPELTIEAIAARAGVGKQTIYRWWPSKGAVAIDALLDVARPAIGIAETADLAADLGGVLDQVTALLAAPDLGPHFVACLAESYRDPALGERFAAEVFIPTRGAYRQRLHRAQEAGELAPGVDLDVLLDMAFGALWLRALTRPEQLTRGLGSRIATVVLEGAQASGS